MPQYFFHLRDHRERLLDPQGRLIADPDEIPGVALSEVRSLISQDVLAGEIDLRQRLEVEDEHGLVVHSLPFSHAVRIIVEPA